jgi:hypothetical protein
LLTFRKKLFPNLSENTSFSLKNLDKNEIGA